MAKLRTNPRQTEFFTPPKDARSYDRKMACHIADIFNLDREKLSILEKISELQREKIEELENDLDTSRLELEQVLNPGNITPDESE